MKQKTYDVIVVGGGAAGLMAAIHAASGGAHTVILDHHEVSGKKILATGNGKCNFTNLMQGESYYRCDTPAFVLHILEQFSAEDTIAFFRELGVMTRDRQGYCYPRSGQASAIRNALLRKAEKLGIEIPIVFPDDFADIMGLESAKSSGKTIGFPLIQKVGAFFRPAVFWLPEVWHRRNREVTEVVISMQNPSVIL